jgi:teichuronic acid biosynthesis glycosyltransferase TuaG
MENTPLISVIMPAYNSERYIAAALDSILAQTYTNWETIVVDDGSRDGTAEIVKSYVVKDARIKYVFQENQRMAAARNKALSIAQGKYIAFLDNDDLFVPEKLVTQVAFMESHPECDISYGKIQHFYDGEPDVLYVNRNEGPLEGDAFRSFLWRNSVNVLQTMVRKELFEKYGAFQGKWPACDEQYLWVNFARHGAKFVAMDAVVGLYREHRGSDSHRKQHIYYTAESFLKMLDLIESTLTPAEVKEYGKDFIALRKKYKRMLLIGWFMKTPPTSWVLYPLYIGRRGRYLTVVS